MWKQPVGGGYASFTVARGRAFTIEQRGEDEVVAAYDVVTGRELWTNSVADAVHGVHGRRRPARDADVGGRARVRARRARANCAASTTRPDACCGASNILEDNGATNLDWGMAASPLDRRRHGDRAARRAERPVGRRLRSPDGDRAWSALDDRAGYSSPMLVTLGGVRQLLVFSASRLMGLTPDGGDVLWEYPWTTMSDVNVVTAARSSATTGCSCRRVTEPAPR